MTTLLSALELIQKSPLSKDFPPSKICPIIEASEELIFESCALGAAFYGALIEDLTEIPANLKEWSATKTYAINDVVTYYGVVIKSKIGTNVVNPCEDVDETAWEIVPKFQTACVNDFWPLLSLYLSYHIVGENVTVFTYHLGGKGTTKYSEEFRQNTSGLVTVERGERVDYTNAITRLADKYYNAVLLRLKKKYLDCPILATATYVADLCADCAPVNRTRRIYYKN